MNESAATSPATETKPAPAPRELPAIIFVKQLRDGEFITELDERIHDIHAFVAEHGKAASVTIKFTFTPSGRTISVDDDISEKVPKKPKDSTIFYSDRGELSRKDPKQIDLAEIDPAFRGNRQQ